MGTFHAKYLIVDRRIACISSNNIQDRVNLEMNIHIEGAIVDSFYDMALLSWGEKMDPPLPLLVNPGLVDRRPFGVKPQVDGVESVEGGEQIRDPFEEARLRKAEMVRTSADALPTHPGMLT